MKGIKFTPNILTAFIEIDNLISDLEDMTNDAIDDHEYRLCSQIDVIRDKYNTITFPKDKETKLGEIFDMVYYIHAKVLYLLISNFIELDNHIRMLSDIIVNLKELSRLLYGLYNMVMEEIY